MDVISLMIPTHVNNIIMKKIKTAISLIRLFMRKKTLALSQNDRDLLFGFP